MRAVLAALALAWLVVASASAQPAGVGYGPGPCPFAASSCTATATGQSTSVTAQTLADWSGEVIDVLRNGVKCDGSTDDATALAAIMTKAGTRANSLVYFPPNPALSSGATTCMLSAAIAVPASTTLWASPGTVTLKPTAGNVTSPVLISMGNNTLVYGLTIDGGGADFGTANNVVQAFQNSNAVLDHVTVQHTRGVAFLASTSMVNSGVRDSTFADIGNHWKTTQLTADRKQAVAFCCGVVANSHGNFVTGSYFTDIGLDAISATQQTDFLTDKDRFDLADGQITATWINPQPVAFGAAVYASGGNGQTTATNHTIIGAQGNALDIEAGDAVIANNYISTSGQAGIGFFGSGATSSGAVTGNVVINSAQWPSSTFTGGITLSGAIGRLSLSSNVVTDTQGSKTQQYGVQAISGTTYTDLHIDPSNVLTGNLTSAFGGVVSDYSYDFNRDNRILNPCFGVDQRNEGGTYPFGGGVRLIMDQWASVQTNNAFTAARSSSTAFIGCPTYSLHLVLTGGPRVAGANDFYTIGESIEALSLQDLNYGTSSAVPLVLEFAARSSVAGTYSATLVSAATRSYVIPFTIAANTITYYSFIIPGDTAGSLGSSGYGLTLYFDFGSGSNKLTSTTLAWTAGLFRGASTETLWIGSAVNSTFDISSVRLYPGTSHVPWAQRMYAEELAILQRYYWKTFADGVAPATNTGSAVGATTMIDPGTGATGVWVHFPVRMRVAPAVTFYSTNAATANCYDATAAADGGAASAVNAGVDGMFVKCASASVAGDQLQVHIAATAE